MERRRKRELRELNARAWAGDKEVFPVSESLDSSLKKNTAFIKRLRTSLSGAGTSTFLQELRTLSLHKYLSEVISACYEGLSKVKIPADVPAAIEVFSGLHQRFGPDEFTSYIGWQIGRGLSTPEKTQLLSLPQDVREKEEKERTARHKILLRMATELWLVGGLRSLDDVKKPEEVGKTKENARPIGSGAPKAAASHGSVDNADAEPFPLEVLKDILRHDGQHLQLPLAVQFVKAFTWDILGKKSLEEHPVLGDDEPLCGAGMQGRFRNVLSRYFEGASHHLVRDQNHLNSQSRRNAEAYVRSGEIFEDRQANYEKQAKAQEKFVANMQILAEVLDLELPDLTDKDSAVSLGDGAIGLVKAGDLVAQESEGAGIWEDEDERRFYENIIDLKDRVPSILLDEPKKKKAENDEQIGKKADDKASDGLGDTVEKHDKNEGKAEDPNSLAIANKTVGAQVDGLLARLPEMTSKEMADEIAYDFCFVNSKASRNRLIKALEEPPRGRTDLLPLYARLVATLGRHMADVSQALLSYLDDEFRSLQRRKQKDTLGSIRSSNIRYLAELTKFGLVPEHVIFHCLKVSLDDFSKVNIEIICQLLEHCGRFLLRNPDTSPRMRSFLETLQRKKSVQHIGQQDRMLIENAVYYVNPPERAAIQQKERTPVDLFVRKLVYADLTKRNIEKVAKQLRKLHWEEQEVVQILHKVFVKPYRMKYSNIHFLAILLGDLHRYHQDFTIPVVDEILENIVIGLEMNDFKRNQRRVAEVKYLGELYVYKMVDSAVIFDTLFKLLCFGHGGWPKVGVLCALDLPDDFFRIRLVCSLLETCGVYFEKGSTKKRLDFFLIFFQYYIQTKDPLPRDVDFLVDETIKDIRPELKLAANLEEAGAAFAEACKQHYHPLASNQGPDATEAAEAEVEDEIDDLDDDLHGDGQNTPPVEDVESSEDEVEDGIDDQPETPDITTSESEDEHIVVTRPEDQRDPEADAEFDRELAKMMAESLESRKTERRPMFDVALPMRKAQRDFPAPNNDSGDEAQQPVASTVKFSLLSKKGNKPHTRSIDLPADSNFAVAMRTQQEAERAEQQRIKKLVLNYDLSEDHEEGSLNGPPRLLEGLVEFPTDIADSADISFVKGSVSIPSYDRQTHTKHHSSGKSSSDNHDRHGSASQTGRSASSNFKRGAVKKLQLSDLDWT